MRAIEGDVAAGDSGTCQKIGSPFFEAGRRESQPSAHLFEPRVAWTRARERAYTRARVLHDVRARTHAGALRAAACGPNLTKSGQMSISNVAQVAAVAATS